ncbi:CHAD domain-containing protein [Streptomyces sp. JNUCC 64]
MAHRNLDPVVLPPAGDVLAAYLQGRATDFLRSLRADRAAGPGGPGTGAAHAAAPAPAAELRRSARRISATLHTFRPLLDGEWSDGLRAELAWVSGTLARERAHGERLERLLTALARLSGRTPVPGPGPVPDLVGAPASASATASATISASASASVTAPRSARTRATTAPASATSGSASAPVTTVGPPAGAPAAPGSGGPLALGAAKAGALLERQLTLARTRAHTASLEALGSARFHAVADAVAVLASEVRLAPGAATAPATALVPLAREAEARLLDAARALPLLTAGHPYNAQALVDGLTAGPAPQTQDTPWHQVRLLLRLHRYAREVLRTVPHDGGTVPHDGPAPYGGGPAPGGGPARDGAPFPGDGPDAARLLRAGGALDRHRDASEAAAAAATAARTPRIAPATAYALGVLHADQRHEVEAARYAFQRAWTRETTGR